MKSWEYKLDILDEPTLLVSGSHEYKSFKRTLNNYGGEGWELVSTFSHHIYENGDRSEFPRTVFIFKREKS